MVYFKEKCIFPRVQKGSIIFPGGGSNFLQGGPIAFPCRNPYNLYLFQEGSEPLVLPLGPLMQYLVQLDAVTKVSYEKKLSISNLPECAYIYIQA